MRLLGTVPASLLKSSAVHFQPRDVLYGRLRPYLNKVYRPDFEGLCSAEFIVFPDDENLNSKWLAYLLNSSDFVSFSSHQNLGDRPRVDFDQIGVYEVLLPPKNEQGKIVEEIEKQFTRLDAAVAALKRVQANLKRYRAAMLKAACEGRLVPTEAELARKEGRSYETGEQLLARSRGLARTDNKRRAGRLWGAGVVPELTAAEKNLLPPGWAWAKVRELGTHPDEVVQVGPMSMRSQDFVTEGTPVLNVGCVQWGYFEEAKLNYLPPLKAQQFERYRILPGDVMFTRSGTVGRCAVAQSHQAGWLMTFHLLRARPHPEGCLPGYLRVVFEGAGHVRRQAREASIGTTRAGFNTSLLANLDVPLPPLAEQRRILEAVEGQMTNIKETEAGAERAQRRAERLRQSILKRAFEGKLVPPDPNDEPASVLLERIHTERVINSPKKWQARGKCPSRNLAATRTLV
jgi:type I restriction enzyme S subunit